MNPSNLKFYKVKNPKTKFICALCKAPREMRYKKNLDYMHYMQMLLISGVLSWLLYPVMQYKVAAVLFIVWAIFEFTNKIFYRKELPCPYCGFDATWYKRDLKIAKIKVADFWQKNYPDIVAQQNRLKEEKLKHLQENSSVSMQQNP